MTTHINSASVNLMPNTEYFFEVLAYNSAGDGPSSSIFGPLKTPESGNINLFKCIKFF